jgi:hypothetical protein
VQLHNKGFTLLASLTLEKLSFLRTISRVWVCYLLPRIVYDQLWLINIFHSCICSADLCCLDYRAITADFAEFWKPRFANCLLFEVEITAKVWVRAKQCKFYICIYIYKHITYISSHKLMPITRRSIYGMFKLYSNVRSCYSICKIMWMRWITLAQ